MLRCTLLVLYSAARASSGGSLTLGTPVWLGADDLVIVPFFYAANLCRHVQAHPDALTPTPRHESPGSLSLPHDDSALPLEKCSGFSTYANNLHVSGKAPSSTSHPFSSNLCIELTV